MTQQHDEGAARDSSGGGATSGQGSMDGGVKDDLEGGTTGATSMTGGDRSDASSGQQDAGGSEAAPGGRPGGAASADMGPIGMESATPGAAGERGEAIGAGVNGSFGSGTYNEQGRVVGPDSPAGAEMDLDAGGEGQGDDLANRLGGDAARGTGMTGAAAVSGSIEAGRSERADAAAAGAGGAGGPDAGSFGGMGGARARGGTGAGRPPGGVSPVLDSPLDQD